jgi:hypothetical protein
VPPPGGSAPPPPPGGSAPPPDGRSSVPFEDTSIPFFSRWWQTVSLSLSRPSQLFSNLPNDDLGGPVIYAAINGTIAGIFGVIWQFFFGGLAALVDDAAAAEFLVSSVFMGFFVVLMPALVIVGLFISTAIYHVCLLLFGDAQRGFGVTLRAVAYASGPNLFAIVPICGGIVGGIWVLVLTIMGAFYGHRTDAWRAILAYFLPLIVCCGVGFLLFSLLMGLSTAQGF